MGDLIRAGVSGAAGHVDEPFLDATIRPEILFPAYASGRNLAEAYYAAMPYLSWQTIIVGDPLCAPFPHAPLPTQTIDAGVDAATELPSYYAKRRLAGLTGALNKDAAAHYLRAESRTERKDTAGTRQALEAAVAAEPKFSTARLQLATAADADRDYDRAIAQFRAILAYSPNDAIALNNLAFDLAVYRDRAEEALPLAQRAVAVSKTPATLDTLAWIQHLLKRDAEAAATMRLARSTNFIDADVLWHSAVIYAAVNDLPRAAAELTLALKLKPELGERDDVKKLRQQLPGAAK
jgi:tetratricopeptide (TPR) repeat protein